MLDIGPLTYTIPILHGSLTPPVSVVEIVPTTNYDLTIVEAWLVATSNPASQHIRVQLATITTSAGGGTQMNENVIFRHGGPNAPNPDSFFAAHTGRAAPTATAKIFRPDAFNRAGRWNYAPVPKAMVKIQRNTLGFALILPGTPGVHDFVGGVIVQVLP